MTDEQKIKRVEFAPGVLEQMEETFSPDELQEIMDSIKGMIEDGSFFDKAHMVNMNDLKQEDPELYAHLVEQINSISDGEDPPQKTMH